MGDSLLAAEGIRREELGNILDRWVERLGYRPGKSLLIPPDYTRRHSWAGPITAHLYRRLSDWGRVEILPALGTHERMSGDERRAMFGPEIPEDRFIDHDWRRDVRVMGDIPGAVVQELSGGRLDYSVEVGVNRRILDGGYDRIVSVGQVVPHEVAGMANHNKNILVGCGGKDIIDKSHFLGAVHGIERTLGRTDTPVRRLFDQAERQFLKDLPIYYVQTVTSVVPDERTLAGLYIGRGREPFEAAAQLSREINLTLLERPLRRVVVYLEPDHFRSMWLGNKAIYRTRMAIADGGELIVIAPGVRQFGEDPGMDRLIRAYGYRGTPEILEKMAEKAELRDNLSAAAHLIHGSTEGRFRVVYAAGGMDRATVESVGFDYIPLEAALRRYRPESETPGSRKLPNGETVYYIPNPALGLWALRQNFLAEEGRADESGNEP